MDSKLNQWIKMTTKQVIAYRINSDGNSELKEYRDYHFTTVDQKNDYYLVYIVKKIQDNMLNKKIRMSTQDILKYYINSNGTSDLQAYKHYYFTMVNQQDDSYLVTITQSIPDTLLNKPMKMTFEKVSEYKIMANKKSAIPQYKNYIFDTVLLPSENMYLVTIKK